MPGHARRRGPDLVRGAEEQEGAEAAPEQAVEEGADLVFVWGGDGMVQRCIDALRRHRARRSRSCPRAPPTCSPTNLGIPKDLDEAVDIGLHGARRRLDVGVVNGERFAVMAGAGFDALMIRDADGA